MATTTIVIDDKEIINELERLHYEFEGKKEIITYMLSSNINQEKFEDYHNGYIEVFKAYQKKKKEFENRFVRSKISTPKNWNLDFSTGELVIAD